eukprot:4691989-Pyramimonas_sp.AAC.1
MEIKFEPRASGPERQSATDGLLKAPLPSWTGISMSDRGPLQRLSHCPLGGRTAGAADSARRENWFNWA